MRITWLLEVADQLWGGVKVVLERANRLARRGHEVTILSRSGPPAWMQLDCAFRQVGDYRPERLPDADVLIGTLWTTVPWVAAAGRDKGVPVHFCQGIESDAPEHASLRDRIDATYRLTHVHRVTIAPHLTRALHQRFGVRAHEVRHSIDHAVHFAGAPRSPQKPLRVGMVGPWQLPGKGIATGYAACRLAHAAGQELLLVRANNMARCAEEFEQPFPVEWHQDVPPDRMGDFYRSLDLLLGTSADGAEGFFLPAVEAMACGVPAVLTDVPCFRGHRQLVGHDRYALFVPPSDPTEMAEALVLAGSLPDVRATLRAGGIEVASHFDADRHGDQLERVLHELVAHAEQRPVMLAAPAARERPARELRLVEGAPRESANPADTARPNANAEAIAGAIDIADLLARLRTGGEQAQAAGRHDEAARCFAAARCLAPDDDRLLRRLAATHLAAGRAEQALLALDRLAAGGADDEELHTGRGLALQALGRVRDAAQAFRAALAVGRRTADVHNRLGVVLFAAGDIAAARACFERALVLQPDHDEARENLSGLPAA